MNESPFRQSTLVIVSEMVFILAPVCILLIVLVVRGNWVGVITAPDWSYATIVMIGQTIVKLSTGLSHNQDRKQWHFVTLLFTLLVMLEFAPAVIVLVLLLTSKQTIVGLVIAQWLLLLLAGLTYWNVAKVGQILLDHSTLRSTNGT